MESYLLQISCRNSGSLLQNKTFLPIDGPILSINNSSVYKSISFVRAVWSKSGTKIAACDCHGSIYLFDFSKSRFNLVHRFNTCCSYMIFASDFELLVALADCNIAVINLENKSIRNKFTFHSASVTCISFDKSGLKVLSASRNEAILWDLTSFDILRALTLKKDVDIIKVFFLPDNDIIVSAFKDNSVFLWDYKHFTCICQFLCSNGKDLMKLKTVDCSWDEKLIACAGKVNWFIVWSIPEQKGLYTVSLPENISVKELKFLHADELSPDNDNYILSVLTSQSDICIYNLKDMELLHSIKNSSNKIISFASSTDFRLLTICLQGNLDVYDVGPFIINTIKETPISKLEESDSKNVPQIKLTTSKVYQKKTKRKKKSSVEINKESLKSMVKNFEEYPEKYRFFIWSQLLELPHNVDAFKVLHQDSLLIKSFVKDYSFMNPGTQKTFLRIMSMLACWFPVIREVDYFQCVVFPFVKVLHKNTIMCLETLITYISNWCQNWFIFCPFPPFNILCVVENLLVHHDSELVSHFIKNNISPEIYAWSLLQTSFSEVFNKHQWFKVWDNIFSNSPSFLLYAVAAFNIVMRDVLFRCKTTDQFKQCYRKHGISASVLMQKTYELETISPPEINPESVIGSFSPLPKGTYPSFIQLAEMKVDFQTRVKKSLLDQEIDYLKTKADVFEVKGNYLLELQKLQLTRRKLLLESSDIENSKALDVLARKLENIQKLIQENLTDQIAMLKDSIGYEFITGSEDYHLQFFKFKDYIKKLNTHVPYSSEAKYIYVLRNPKDCCVSMYYHTLRASLAHDHPFANATFDDFFELFMMGEVEYNDYYDHLMSWYPHLNDQNVFFTTYEEMKQDLKNIVLKVASFLGKEYIGAIQQDNNILNNILRFCGFDYMKEHLSNAFTHPRKQKIQEDSEECENGKGNAEDKSPCFFRKGVVADWKNHFSETQNERMNEKFEQRTKGTEIYDLYKPYMFA